MGLGMLALGFILLEGIHITIDSVSFAVPEYISLSIMMVGLLTLRKKMKPQFIDHVILLGILLCLYMMIPNHMIPYQFLLQIDMMSIFINIIFYFFLFRMIHYIVNDNKLKRRMDLFFIIYMMMTPVVFYISYKYGDVSGFIYIVFVVFAFVKALLCYNIGFIWYYHNSLLEEEYAYIEVQQPQNIPRYILILGLCFSLLGLMFVGEPLTQYMREVYFTETYHEENYQWYGQINDDIIIEGMAYREYKKDKEKGEYFQLPFIWINNQDFEEVYSVQMDILIDDVIEYSIESDVSKKEYVGNYNLLGQREGYTGISWYGEYIENIPGPDVNLFDAKLLYQTRDQLSMDVKLIDKDMNVIHFFHVPLYNREDRLRTFNYQDDQMKISQLKIDDDFIVQYPAIKYKDFNDYVFFLSGHSEFSDESIRLEMSYEWETYSQDIMHAYSSPQHTYFPQQKDYYLHVVKYDENNQPYTIKTVRLIEK